MTDLRRPEPEPELTPARDVLPRVWTLPSLPPYHDHLAAQRGPNGFVQLVLNGRQIVAELGPNDAALLAAWLLGEPYPPRRGYPAPPS